MPPKVTMGMPAQQMPRPALTTTMTPEQQIIHTANQAHEITDSTGRRLTVKRPNALDQYLMAQALGVHASNPVCLGYAVACMACLAVDGIPTAPIMNDLHIRARVQLLDNHGLSAINTFLNPAPDEIA